MKATVYSHKTIIGTTDLQVGDEAMGGLYGELIPTEEYFTKTQNTVWEFSSARDKDYDKWNALRLNVQLENGIFLLPRGGYTIDDSPHFPNEPKRIDLAGVDLKMLELSSDPFSAPWQPINIDEKIALEDELKKEITPGNSFFDFLSRPTHHFLVGAEFSAFARYNPNDDVLFEISAKDSPEQFAVVHLTWSHERERDYRFPAVRLFADFEDFAVKRMQPDSTED